MHFVIDFQAEHLASALDAVRREIASPEQMLGSIGEDLLRTNQRRHQQELDPDGVKWKPLADSTVSASGKPRRRILYANGDMLGSFNYQVQGNELALGFSDEKAKWHHDGTSPYTITPKKAKALAFGGIVRARVNHPGLPQRRLIGFPDGDRQLVLETIQDHIELALSRARKSAK